MRENKVLDIYSNVITFYHSGLILSITYTLVCSREMYQSASRITIFISMLL